MRLERKKRKLPTQEYLEMANAMSKEDADRLFSRMRGRYSRRLEDKKYTAIEALALQLEYEDGRLKEWRNNLAKIRKGAQTGK